MKKKAIFNWSGGKDSAITLYTVVQQGQMDIKYLLTSVNRQYQRISMHGVRVELLVQQAKSIGIPLYQLMTPEMPSMKVYNELLEQTLHRFRGEGVTHSIFGDIFLEDLKRYREKELDKVNINRREVIGGLIQSIDNPPYSLKDDPTWVYSIENELLGISLTYHKTETEDVERNATCKEISDGLRGNFIISVEVEEPSEYTIKKGKSKGQKMAALTCSDQTGSLKCLIFTDTWLKFKNKLYPSAVVNLLGFVSQKGDFIINEVR